MRKFLILFRAFDRFCADVGIRPDEGWAPPVQTNTPDNGNSPVSTNPMGLPVPAAQKHSGTCLTADSQRRPWASLRARRAANANELIAGAVCQ